MNQCAVVKNGAIHQQEDGGDVQVTVKIVIVLYSKGTMVQKNT